MCVQNIHDIYMVLTTGFISKLLSGYLTVELAPGLLGIN